MDLHIQFNIKNNPMYDNGSRSMKNVERKQDDDSNSSKVFGGTPVLQERLSKHTVEKQRVKPDVCTEAVRTVVLGKD